MATNKTAKNLGLIGVYFPVGDSQSQNKLHSTLESDKCYREKSKQNKTGRLRDMPWMGFQGRVISPLCISACVSSQHVSSFRVVGTKKEPEPLQPLQPSPNLN